MITKTAFLKKANAICTNGNKLTNADGAKLGQHPTQAQITVLVRTKFIPTIDGQIAAIRALGAPAGDQAKVTMMLNLAQADVNKLKSNPALVGSNGTFANFAKLAHPYGITACAKGS